MSVADTLLLSSLLPQWQGGDVALAAITQDSRQVTAGALFIARNGQTGHGLDHLQQVVAGGAAAIVAEPGGSWSAQRITALAAELAIPLVLVEGLCAQVGQIAAAFHGYPSATLRVVGITGTNGKTSCSHALAAALAPRCRAAVIGTLGNGEPGALMPATHTTPDAVTLQAMLARFRDQGIDLVAMEVSSHALDQGRVDGVHFDTAVFTNLSRDHLDYHQTMAAYGAAKARLFHHADLGVAVINADDPFAADLVAQLPATTRLVAYGMQPARFDGRRIDRAIRAQQVLTTSAGLELLLDCDGEQVALHSHWLGRFNAANLMAVFGVLLEQGFSLAGAAAALSTVAVVPGRMEAFRREGAPLVVVDYAHTPDALEKVLRALRDHCAGELICVFGCGGDRDKGKRPQMGAAAEQYADRVMLTDDNPRSESGAAIIDEIRAGMAQPERALVERRREQAIAAAIALAKPGDVVAVCGKGHETTQQTGSEIREFSDREWVARLLQGVA